MIEKKVSWLQCSLILSEDESFSLVQMTQSLNGTLLYRATIHGFNAYHSKCNGIGNTITIIKSNLNHVFGAFTPSNDRCPIHSKAFIFSLRRSGVSKNDKFIVKDGI